MARAAEHLVLISAGFDPLGVIVVEAGHLADAAPVSGGTGGYADGGVAGVAAGSCSARRRWPGAEVSPVAAALTAAESCSDVEGAEPRRT